MAFLKLILYIPLYNGLIFLIGIIPGSFVGVAVIVFTAFIKLLLFPLSYKASKFQLEMKAHDAEIRKLKEKFKDDKQAQGKAIMDFYKEKGINPFAGILPIFIQIPLVIALYYVFYNGGLPQIDYSLLYSFVPVPEPNMNFLWLDIGGKSFFLAILTAVTQFLQASLATPPPPPKSDKPSFGDDMARGMHFQMKFILPLFIGFVAYHAAGAIALYFITSNVFAIGQELYLRKQFKSGEHITHKLV